MLDLRRGWCGRFSGAAGLGQFALSLPVGWGLKCCPRLHVPPRPPCHCCFLLYFQPYIRTHSSTRHLWVTRNSLHGLHRGSALEMETQWPPLLFPLHILSCAELFLQPDAPTLRLSGIHFEALTHRAVSRPGSLHLQALYPAAPNTGHEQTTNAGAPTPQTQRLLLLFQDCLSFFVHWENMHFVFKLSSRARTRGRKRVQALRQGRPPGGKQASLARETRGYHLRHRAPPR